MPRPSGKQPVLGINPKRVFVDLSAPAIRLTGHDQAVQRFAIPPRIAEPHRQPIQQLGVTGPLALQPEVLRRSHQTNAEMVLPHPVHHHPRGQRMFIRHQPLGQSEPVPRPSLCQRRQKVRHIAFDLLTGLVVFPAVQDVGRTHLRALGRHQRRGC